MFRVKFDINTQQYTFETTDGAVSESGNLTKVSETAIQYGIQQDELAFAYKVMAENVHTIAEFGVRGCFLFSHNGREEQKTQYLH